MNEHIACPVCQHTHFESYLVSKDHFLTGEEFTICKCNDCGFLFTNPRPEENDLPGYYQSEEYISHSNTSSGMVSRMYKLVRNIALSQKVRLVKKYQSHGRSLDIGCGTGHFLHALSKKGFEVTGVEPEASARNFAVRENKLTVHASLDPVLQKGEKFDVITLWHVLEHVFDLNAYITQIQKLISPAGILIVAVPNSRSYDAEHYKEYWAAYDLPRHLYHFSSDTVNRLFEKHQFDLVNILPMKFDAFYVSMLSEKYEHGRNRYLKAIRTGIKSNFRASRNENNYSSLIFVLKPKN